MNCACGCGKLVTGRGRHFSRACWARVMNASWTAERKFARSHKAGKARWAKHPAMCATSRFL
jgi:hypothetical protein